ncbi:MAG: site-specific integrase [Actinobacteria bacterium]|nr:site-specific integrase [Actinomycetota bacterium]
MSDLAPLLQAFFTNRLMGQRQASAHTIAAYRDAFKLLLGYVARTTGRHPAQLSLTDLDAATIAAFLQHLEADRGNSVVTRNARLAAIHSFYSYAAPHAPEHLAIIQQVLAIPAKRVDRAIVSFLTRAECDALIAAPDTITWLGRRDHTLLLVAIHTGLRVSELINLAIADVGLGAGPHLRCTGKGRKNRCTPLTRPAARALRAWLSERTSAPAEAPVFTTRSGQRLSRDAITHLVARHTATAVRCCPTLATKTVSPHTLRHSTAMALLAAGTDISVIALWLGHESTDATQIYLHADMSIKERALARVAPASAGTMRRYKPPDTLLRFLDNL